MSHASRRLRGRQIRDKKRDRERERERKHPNQPTFTIKSTFRELGVRSFTLTKCAMSRSSDATFETRDFVAFRSRELRQNFATGPWLDTSSKDLCQKGTRNLGQSKEYVRGGFSRSEQWAASEAFAPGRRPAAHVTPLTLGHGEQLVQYR